MEFLSDAKVQIKTIKRDGDIKDRMARRHVIELAASIARLGGEPMNKPIMRMPSRDLIAGRDRLAAAMINKETHISVRRVTGTDAEMQRLERDENLRRRDINREKLLAEASKQEAAEIKAKEAEEAARAKESGTSVPPKKKGKTAVGKAREATAKKAGIKAESVRKAEQRQKAKEAPAKPAKPPIDLLGRTVNKAALTAFQRIVDLCKDLDGDSRGILSELSKAAHLLPGAVLERLREPAKALGDAARAIMPTAICYECWGEGDEKCKLCKGSHYARYEQMKDVPKEKLQPPPKAENGVAEAHA